MADKTQAPAIVSAQWPIIDTASEPIFYDLSFFVEGPARAKQSFRYRRNGHSFQSARVKGWQADVGWAAQQAMRQQVDHLDRYPLHDQIAVEMVFFLKPTKKTGKAARIDLDNLSKGVLDGLNGIAWDDDQQIIDLHLRKAVCGKNVHPGVNVFIKEIKPN